MYRKFTFFEGIKKITEKNRKGEREIERERVGGRERERVRDPTTQPHSVARTKKKKKKIKQGAFTRNINNRMTQ